MNLYLEELIKFGIKPGLHRIKALLNELGNPEQELRCIHVAGTNGKGSVSYIIASVLGGAGYKTGRFSSPHLHSYRERFTINDQKIEARKFKQHLEDIRNITTKITAGGGDQPTEFEVLTALGLKYFRDNGVNPAVLEVGLGGAYDSTNVVVPLISVITGIDFDHQAVLGDTLREIAANKAGIIKRGVPVIAGPMPPEALNVIKEKAASEDTCLFSSEKIIIKKRSASILAGQILDIQYGPYYLPGIEFGLLGDYQLENLRIALNVILALERCGYRVSKSALVKTLKSLKLPGRMEVVSGQPPVIIDAAHNPQGAKALADSLATLLPGRKKVLLCGYLDDKDAGAALDCLGQDTSCCVISRPKGHRAVNWQRAAEIWKRKFPGIKYIIEEDIDNAVQLGLRLLNCEEYMLITGSFYLIDQARQHFVKF